MLGKKITIRKGQLGLLSKEGDYFQVLEAGEHRLPGWFSPPEVMLVNLDDAEVATEMAEYLRHYQPDWCERYCLCADLNDNEVGLLFQDNVLLEILPPLSRRLFWKQDERRRIERLSLEQARLPDSVVNALLQLQSRKQTVKGAEGVMLVQIPAWYAGVLKIDGVIQPLLETGNSGYWHFNHELEVTMIGLDEVDVPEEMAEYLRHYQQEWSERYCLRIDLAEDEVGLRFENGVLREILPPSSRRLFWQRDERLHIERLGLTDAQAPADVVNALLQPKLRNRAVKGAEGVMVVQVPAWHVGVLKIDGATQDLLAPGVSAYWRFNHTVEAEVVDTRLQALEISGQEILTRDKVNLRLNLAANWRYHDVLRAFGQLAKPVEHLYRELQFALREAVGTRSLDELLENKQLIDEVVSAQAAARLTEYGIELASLGVKDIILPGEMKTILSRLVEAEKSAQANVIRRREETAATRSLLNTAKVMENNPVALRLKELETLEKVAERIDKISVFGGLDQVLQGLVQIKGA